MENYDDISYDEPVDFYYVNSSYDIKSAGKHKSYSSAFDHAEKIEQEHDRIVLLYFDKKFGIEIFNEFLTYLKGKK